MKKRKISFWIGIILIICSALLLIISNKSFQNHIINASQQRIVKNFNRSTNRSSETKKGNYDSKDTSLANANLVLKNRLESQNVQPIGIMSIPNINMKNPILNGYGPKGAYLALGACTMQSGETPGLGNYALAGHYMKSNTVFHSLSNAKVGMHIFITDRQKIYDYQITSNEVINHMDVSVLNQTNQPTITLITCVGLNETPLRTCVKGKLVNTLPATKQLLKKDKLNY